jgi:hypothetical protein
MSKRQNLFRFNLVIEIALYTVNLHKENKFNLN